MCGKSCSIELAKNDRACISICKGCKRYSVNYTNTSFSFSRDELINFRAILISFKESDFCYNIMNQSRAILKTQYTNMGFSVSRYDIRVLNELIREALVISEVYELLN